MIPARPRAEAIFFLAFLAAAMGVVAGCPTPPGARRSKTAPPRKAIEVLREDERGRLVRHLAGETLVPSKPRRIVSLGTNDELVALGSVPAAALLETGRFQDYLQSGLAGALPVGSTIGSTGPNIEAVLGAAPDLILASWWLSDRAAVLSRIAPTIVISGEDGRHADRLVDVGRILGLEAAARKRAETYAEVVRQEGERLRRVLAGETVAIVKIQARSYAVFGDTWGPGLTIFRELELRPARLVVEKAFGQRAAVLTEEHLADLDADHIFLIPGRGSQGNDQVDDAYTRRSPLWHHLRAVEKRNVHSTGFPDAWLADGILAREQVIRDVARAFEGREAPRGEGGTANP